MATEGQTLSETPCHAQREEPEENDENTEELGIQLAAFVRENVCRNATKQFF